MTPASTSGAAGPRAYDRFEGLLHMVEDSPADLAQLLGALAVEMQEKADTESTLASIVEGAITLVPGARWAGISMITGRDVRPRVPSDPLVAELDKAQSALDQGPCLSALREHHTVLIQDMGTETRWPRFTRLAVKRGVHSLLSFQLFVEGENLGALNLYGVETCAFNEESIFIGEVLAQHASVALAGAAADAQFHTALSSRDVIGQAKGILMHRENFNGVQAFQLLLKTSQNSNIKIVELARWVVEQHESGLTRT